MNDDIAVKIFSALSQPTRFSVFRLLIKHGKDGMPAGKIAEELGVQQNTLSSHLNIMANARIISYERNGRVLNYKVEMEYTRLFMDYLVTDCCNGKPELCSFLSADRSAS